MAQKLRFLIVATILMGTYWATAQKKNADYVLNIRRATSPIVVDGVRDDRAWQDAEVAKDFHMILPFDTSMAEVLTEVQMAYDDQNIYLIAVCYTKEPGPNFVESMRRDWGFQNNDNFIFCLDTFDDQTNGFTFGANAAGAQWDGTMYEGSRVDLSWDNKWSSASTADDEKYIFEMALPFKTIRYKEGITQWGVNFGRNDLKTTEKSSWAPVPRQFPSISLAYTGILQWDEPPPAPSTNISLIPYTAARATKNYNPETDINPGFDVGADAKIAVTSSLNLDLTVNPDFSQVDVDQQVTNLDRFELFFPERRQFFLENGDLFANFGYSEIRPFFSRRIGLNAPILFGARLSGKVNRDWRIGAMDMQTGAVDSVGLPAQNFAVVALQRRVFSRSNVGFIFANKQSVNYNFDPTTDNTEYATFNRNAGIEFNLASSNNLWTGKMLALKSFNPDNNQNSMSHAGNLRYSSRKWQLDWRHEYVGENYDAEMGYVPRTGFVRFSPQLVRNFFPDGKVLLSHGPAIGTILITDTDFSITDYTGYASYEFVFRSRDMIYFWSGYDYVKLLFPFDPTNGEIQDLPTFSEHNWNSYGFGFSSRPQSIFTYEVSGRFGGYYQDGTRQNIEASIGIRYQPYLNLQVSGSRDDIRLEEPWGKTVYWLVGPRLDITFTKNMYWTTFLQYNDQQDNINLNTRFQWRYAPASDLFIVYTDNYLPQPFEVRNRALVMKFTYWWNL